MKTTGYKNKANVFAKFCLGFLLAAILCLTAGANAPAAADEIDAEMGLDSVQDIFNLDGVMPRDMQSLPGSVYDNNQDTPFLLSEQNELFMFIQGAGASNTYLFDTVNLSEYDDSLDKSNEKVLKHSINQYSAQSSPTISTDIFNEMTYTEGVSFDPTGSGRRDHVAVIGLRSGKNIELVVQDTTTGKAYSHYLGQASWMGNTSNIRLWQASSFMDITAGDYDHDGKDTLMVYFSGDSDYKIREVTFNGSNGSFSSRDGDVVNIASVVKRSDFGKAYQKPVVSLTTGDTDGDGIEEFAYMAGFYNPYGKTAGFSNNASSIEPFCSCVAVMDRGNKGWEQKALHWMNEQGQGTGTIGEYNYILMHGGAVAAGDTDGDGVDEIVAVGYTSEKSKVTFSNGSITYVTNAYNIDKSNYAYSVIYLKDKEYLKSDISTVATSNFMRTTFDKSDYIFQEVSLESAKVNGANAPEYFFVSGVVYSFDGKQPSMIFQGDMVRDLGSMLGGMTGTSRKDSSVNWVQNVTAGNFDDNEAGREQFVFVAYEKHSGSKYNSYSANLGVIAGVNYVDSVDKKTGDIISFGTTNTMASSLYMEECYKEKNYLAFDAHPRATQIFVDDTSSTTKNASCLNALPIAVDCDKDGLLAKSGKRGYVYSDPEVHAVLEAAPYYEELDSLGAYDDTGETSYTIESSFGYASSSGNSVSFGVGFAGEVSGPGVKASLEAGYSLDWSESIENAVETSYSTTFSVGSQDIVVLSRTPEVVYCYDVFKNGSWVQNGYTVRMPLAPTYFLLTIEDYNDFVDQYNAKIASVAGANYLSKITDADLPADHIGNPFAYWNGWKEAGQGNAQISKSTYTVNTSGGSTSSEWSTSATQTESTETSHGFSYSLTVQFGGGLDLIIEAEAWAGGYINLDYSHSSGYSKSKTQSNGAGGTVSNPRDSVLKAQKLSTAQINAYHFKWTFGKWTRKLMADKEVPFYGYAVSDVSAPARPVRDLSAEFVTDDEEKMTVRVTWSDPGNKYLPTESYTLYLYDDEGNKETLGEFKADTTEYIFDGVDGRTTYTFTMSVKCKKLKQQSIESTPATLTMESKAIYDIKLTEEAKDKDTYTIFYTDGETSSFVVKHGKDGKDGKDGEKGEKGDTGATGPAGPQGQQGPQGAPGQQGPQGDPGPAGSSSGSGSGSGSGVSVTPFMSPSEPTNQIGVVIGFDGGYKMYITSDGIGFQMPDGSFLYDLGRMYATMLSGESAGDGD